MNKIIAVKLLCAQLTWITDRSSQYTPYIHTQQCRAAR